LPGFPFYYLLKVSFLVWLMHPYTKGAQYLYDNHLHAVFAKYSGVVDGLLARLTTGASTAGVVAGRVAGVVLSEANRAAAASAAASAPAAKPAATFDPAQMFGSHNRSE
jgi:hypothetical protein